MTGENKKKELTEEQKTQKNLQQKLWRMLDKQEKQNQKKAFAQ